jgi:hypothetical protein
MIQTVDVLEVWNYFSLGSRAQVLTRNPSSCIDRCEWIKTCANICSTAHRAHTSSQVDSAA